MSELTATPTVWIAAFAIAAAAVVVSILATKFPSYLGLLMVRLSTLLLPPAKRERYREEWSADVTQKAEDGHQLAAFRWGIGTFAAATRLAQTGTRARSWAWGETAGPTVTLLTLDAGLALWVWSLGLDRNSLLLALGVGLALGLGSWLLSKPTERPTRGLSRGLAYGLTLGLTYGLFLGLTEGLTFGLISGLTFGLIYGLVEGLDYDQEPVGLGIGLTIGLGFVFAYGPIFGLSYLLTFVAAFALAPWLAALTSRVLRLIVAPPPGV